MAQSAALAAATGTPLVLDDPRFQAGRELVKRGLSDEGGVEIFGTLLEELNVKYGGSDSATGGTGNSGSGTGGTGGGNALKTEETTTSTGTGTDTGRNNDTTSSRNIECAPAYYEYGNALHYAALSRREREQQQQQQQEDDEEEENNDDDDDDEKKPAAAPTSSSTGGQPKDDGDGNGNDDDDDDDDLQLALEMMESAFSILQLYEEDATTTITGDNSSGGDDKTKYLSWVQDQLPRVLMGIGDVLSSLGRFPDATDVFTRALERRKEQLEQKKGLSTGSTSTSTDNASMKPDPSLELLKSYRLVCEAAVATAQALLDCPPDEDVITTETKSLLVPKDERISYVEGYYWQARDALQEVLLTLAELEGKGQNQSQTTSQPGGAVVAVDKAMKEDVSHIAILVMGLGEALAEAKEEVRQDQSPGPDVGEPLKKRSKR